MLSIIIKYVIVFGVAIYLGNWFLKEFKRTQMEGKPFYAGYLTIPGVTIILAILFPVILWFLKKVIP